MNPNLPNPQGFRPGEGAYNDGRAREREAVVLCRLHGDHRPHSKRLAELNLHAER